MRKRIVDFLVLLIEPFCYLLWLKHTAFIARGMGQYPPNFHVEGDMFPLIIFTRIDRPMTALQFFHWQFSHKQTL